MMNRTYRIPAIQLDNAALEIVDDQFRVLTIDDSSVAEKCYWKNGKYIIKNIISSSFNSVDDLYERK